MKRTVALIAVLALWPSVAYAQFSAEKDPKDTDGDLDIVYVSYQSNDNPGGNPAPLKLTIEMEDEWESGVLDASNENYLKWNFDTKGGGAWEYSGDFEFRDDKLWFDMRSKKGDQYEPLRAKRLDTKSVQVTIPGGFFPEEGSKFRVWARSRDVVSTECSDEACLDRAPNKGGI